MIKNYSLQQLPEIAKEVLQFAKYKVVLFYGEMGVGKTTLIKEIVKQLGVTDNQAEGGLGSLMQLAKGSLSSGEFSQLSDSVPNMSTLLAAAPLLTSGDGGGMTDMLAGAGGLASSLGGIATLTEQFKALGLSSDMISQFATMAISYFSSDGSGAGALLQKGLGSILG
jgi:predicted ATPase